MTAESYLNWDTTLADLIATLENFQPTLREICGEKEVIVLRDWLGRIHLGFPCSKEKFIDGGLAPLLLEANSRLGPLSSASIAIAASADDHSATEFLARNLAFFLDELFDPADFWESPFLVRIERDSKLKLSLLDRQDKENDWLKRSPHQVDNQSIPRAVFFGVKGGVGRSSALTALALHLSNQGKRVLVVDADFESPGISSSLLDVNVRPDFGLVDWLAAEALGYEGLEDLAQQKIVETSPLSERTQGRILVAPSHGVKTQAYVGKLGRMYRVTEKGAGFAERLCGIVSTLERLHNADVTLVDSRAGIDDTAAAAITQLNARVSFLFGINTQQTWDAYSLLFKHLQHHPSIHTDEDFRYGLRFVSALTPEEVGSTKGYWANFREVSYTTCAENLYDKDVIENPGAPVVAPNNDRQFNPAFDDEDTPHYPLKIMWDEVLRAFDPVQEPGQLASPVMEKVFSDFLKRATRLLE